MVEQVQSLSHRLPWRGGTARPWDARAMQDRVEECFRGVQTVWGQRDAGGSRPFVSDELYRTNQEELTQFDRDLVVNRIEDLRLDEVALTSPVEPSEEEPTETFTALIGFTARDWIEDLRTGETVEGDAESTAYFQQRWHFVHDRRRRWVLDVVEPVAHRLESSEALPRPPGWYSDGMRLDRWAYWDGERWRKPAD